jgi:predicted nucleic acid-binding protein
LSIYADTSFVVSLYVSDRYSGATVQRMVSRPRIWLTPLHSAEWIHAIERHICQKHISRHEAELVYAEFTRDRKSGVWNEVGLPDLAFALCSDLARRYAARFGSRTLDTLHVASAIELNAKSFGHLTSDRAGWASCRFGNRVTNEVLPIH